MSESKIQNQMFNQKIVIKRDHIVRSWAFVIIAVYLLLRGITAYSEYTAFYGLGSMLMGIASISYARKNELGVSKVIGIAVVILGLMEFLTAWHL